MLVVDDKERNQRCNSFKCIWLWVQFHDKKNKSRNSAVWAEATAGICLDQLANWSGVFWTRLYLRWAAGGRRRSGASAVISDQSTNQVRDGSHNAFPVHEFEISNQIGAKRHLVVKMFRIKDPDNVSNSQKLCCRSRFNEQHSFVHRETVIRII